MSRFDRYVFRECLGPIGIGFLATTCLLLIRTFFDLAEAMIQRDLPAMAALKLLGLNVPHIVVVTIPMALLFGILVAVGRLTADSELTAMRACGVSLLYLYRSILTLSLLIAVLNTVLMVWVLPWGNRTLQRLTIEELLKGRQTQAVEPRVFNEIVDGKTLYVFDAPPGAQRWQGVFLADAVPLGEFSFTVAQSGGVVVEAAGRRLIVDFEDAVDQRLDLQRPEEAEVTRHRNLVLVLDEETQGGFVPSASRGLRSMTLQELRATSVDPDQSSMMRNRAQVELHKKFSIPAVGLVFGLLALPLGFSQRAGGKSSAFLQALLVLMAYYLMQSVGEQAAADGNLRPWISMWLPNLVFLVAGAFLLSRRNDDKSLLWSRFDRWMRHHGWRALQRRRPARASRQSETPGPATAGDARFLLHIPAISLRFPSRMDRYILKLFAGTVSLAAAICIGLYIIIDLAGLSRFILGNGISFDTVVEYYFFYSLQIFYTTAPMAVLIATLIVFGVLARSSQITAAKASGMSLYRLAVPAIAGGLLISGLTAGLDLAILPAANSRQAELRAQIKGNSIAEGRRKISRQWYFSQAPDGGGFIYNYLLQTEEPPALQHFQSLRFDPDHRLTGHLFAQSLELARHTDETGNRLQQWVMRDGWVRRFEDGRVVEYQQIDVPQPVDLDVDAEFFSGEIKSSQEMNYWELRDYVDRLKASGQRVPDLEVQIYNKIAMPVICMVMVLVALPFAFRLGGRGALTGIGIAVVIGVFMFAMTAIFTTLGETEALPALAAAWIPNVLFSLLSLYLFLGVRT